MRTCIYECMSILHPWAAKKLLIPAERSAMAHGLEGTASHMKTWLE